MRGTGSGSARTHLLRGAALIGVISASVASCAVAAGAPGVQTASITAALSPGRLGQPSALSLGFEIERTGGGLPSPLTAIDFHYPAQLGLATSGLGVASCAPRALSLKGPKACPPNSIMGYGSALARFQVSPEVSEESAAIALVAGPSQGGYLKLLISATGTYPVAARIVMSTVLLPGHLRVSVPLVPGIPEGPDVAVVRVRATIGGHLTYYRRAHGRTIVYHPPGILLPRHCPRGGFRFWATFSFQDGSSAEARTAVPCAHG